MATAAMALAVAGCDSVDCSLQNVVLCHYAFYDSHTGQAIKLTDTLTITAAGTDSVLFNRGVGKQEVSLPMSYGRDADTLTFSITGPDYATGVTLEVKKVNTPHFDSPDCPSNMFHYLTEVNVMGASYVVDSVIISKPTVNYDTAENIQIYFRTAD